MYNGTSCSVAEKENGETMTWMSEENTVAIFSILQLRFIAFRPPFFSSIGTFTNNTLLFSYRIHKHINFLTCVDSSRLLVRVLDSFLFPISLTAFCDHIKKKVIATFICSFLDLPVFFPDFPVS